MSSTYKNRAGRDAIRHWCNTRLSAAPDVIARWDIATPLGRTQIVEACPSDHTDSMPTVVIIPGTNMNSATYLHLISRFTAAGHRVLSVDVPGQPGLSTGQRPRRRGRLEHYGHWLDDVLIHTVSGPVIVVGHSLGAAITLASTSPTIAGRLLISPAGLTRLAVPPRVLATTLAWLAVPTPARSHRLLRHLTVPTKPVESSLISWMTLVADHCRTSLAPPPLATISNSVPTITALGDHDVFLPARHLIPAVRTRLGTELHVLTDCGHLATHDQPQRVAEYLTKLAASAGK